MRGFCSSLKKIAETWSFYTALFLLTFPLFTPTPSFLRIYPPYLKWNPISVIHTRKAYGLMVQLKRIGPIEIFEHFTSQGRDRIFDRLPRTVTCFTVLAETRTFLPSPNFLMAHFEALYHPMTVETHKNEAVKRKKSSQHLEVRWWGKMAKKYVEFRCFFAFDNFLSNFPEC